MHKPVCQRLRKFIEMMRAWTKKVQMLFSTLVVEQELTSGESTTRMIPFLNKQSPKNVFRSPKKKNGGVQY